MSASTTQYQNQDSTYTKSNPTALKINASATSQKATPQGQTLATGKTSDFKSILASQNTGSDFGASAMADAPDTPKAPLPPLPDLPVRSSNTSSSAAKPINPPPPTSNLSQVSRPDAPAAKAWVAHTDGRTTSVESQPPLKAALPAETEQILSGQQAQRNSNQAPLAKELAQAAKAKEPVAWVAHKDGRLNQVDAEPKLADAMPVKVSERLRDGSSKASSKQHGNKGLFGKVVHGVFQVAKVAAAVALVALASDKVQKEYSARRGRGQDHPVQPVSDRGLLGRKV